jgi:hypothetical protein
LLKITEVSYMDTGPHYSNGIDESKSNNYFLGYYRPLNDSITFDSLKIKAENIWFEKNWTTEHPLLFWEKIKIDSGIHIILPDTSLLSNKLKIDVLISDEQLNGSFNSMLEVWELGYWYSISSKPDTIILSFRTNYGSGLKDTIKYVLQ